MLGTPRHAVRLVDPGVTLLAALVPVEWIRRRRRYLPIFYVASDQTQRSIRLTGCKVHTGSPQ